MYGLGSGPSKMSAARSARTIGATGRNCSRPLTSLRRSRLPACPGWASSERWPSARGPYSERPWNQATMPLSARARATVSAMSGGRSKGTAAVFSQAPSSASDQSRPRSAPVMGSGWSPSTADSRRAPPRAVPASPAAGCTHTRAKGPSRAMRELATQLRATPPARVSTRSWVRPCSQRTRSSRVSSSTAWALAATSAWSCVHGSSGPRGAHSSCQGTPVAWKPPSPVGYTWRRSSASMRGLPWEARAITLNSSEERRKPRCPVSSS